MNTKKTRKIIGLMTLSATLLFVGCGEGDSGDSKEAPKPMTTSSFGILKDLNTSSASSAPSRVVSQVSRAASTGSLFGVYPVKGLNVRCVDSSGDEVTAIYSVTDENGTFSHREGDDCEFCIGNFLPQYGSIGSLIGRAHIDEGGIVTPQGITSRAYVNTLRMLYSLDNDQNRSNGIDISENKAHPFPLTTNDFDYQWEHWYKWHPGGGVVVPYFAPVSEAEVLGDINNPITGVLEDMSYTFGDAGTYQFHNNGALTHLTASGDDIVGGVWSLSNGVITIHFINHTDSFHLVPSSLPLNLGTIIHHQELNEDVSVTSVDTL